MIYLYHTKKLKGGLYVSGSVLKSEFGTPLQPFEFSRPFPDEICDDQGKLQYQIRDNSDYDPKTDHIDDRYIIEHNPIQLTVEELEAERQTAVKRQLIDELPDIILQSKDNPEALVQALCDRAKQIEVEKAKVVR